MRRGQRVCVECGKACWADEDRNLEEAEALATNGLGSLMNPGWDAFEKALEKREIEDGNLCGKCLLDLHELAWSIRQREERLENRKAAGQLRQAEMEKQLRKRRGGSTEQSA